MKLATLIDERNILIHLEASSLEEAIRALVATFGDAIEPLSPEKICESLLEVEEDLGLIPLGHGVRLPHARLGGLQRLLIGIATSQEGIPLKPDSEERAHLIFMVLTPKTQSSVMLQTLASLARLVSVEENRKPLISTTSPSRLLRVLEESGIEVKKIIVAADLMNPIDYRAEPEMTLREVVRLIVRSGEEGIPVVSHDTGELVGDISSRSVIEVGLPPYMNLISDPKVLSDFEPFESFYKKEDSERAEDVMKRDVLSLAPETPVEILAHEMLTKHWERAYIVHEKKLLGVVHRKDIVRKVLYL